MTVASTPRKAGPFNGNGVATSFPFDFKVFSKAEVEVIRTNTLGIESTLVLDSDYTVVLNADQDATPGGTVTYAGPPVLPVNWKLTIIGAADYDQTTDITNVGRFNPDFLEKTLDRIVIMIQQLREIAVRCVQVPPSSTTDPRTMLQEFLQNAADIKQIAATFDFEANQRLDEIESEGNAILAGFTADGNQRLAQFSADAATQLAQAAANANAALRAIGRYPPVIYTAGLAMTSILQTVAYNGQTYAPRADMIPFFTSGTFETAKFQLVQGVSGVDLASREGLPILGYNATEAQAILDNGYPLVSVAQLRTFTRPARRVTITGVAGRAKPDPRSGPLDLMPGDTTTADNDVDVYVDGAGRRWKRPHEGWVYAGWAGAMGDGVTEDRAALQKALDTGYSVYCDKKAVYRCSSTLTQKTPVQCLDGRGSWLDAYALPSNTPLIVFDPTLDSGWPVDFQPSNVRGLRHMVLMGPGKAGGGASYEGTSIGIRAGAPHVPVQGVMIYGFGVGVELPSFSYIQGWDLCNIAQCGVGIWAKAGGSDYGERLVYSRCCIYDNKLAIKNDCPTGALQFDHCSVDYNLKTLEASNGSMTELNGTWVECNDAGAGKVHMSLATGAQLTMTGGRLQQNGTPGALAQDAFLSVDATARASFRDIFAFNLRNSANVFSIGAGLVEFDGVKSYPVSYLPSKISPVANNRLSDSGFALTSVVDLWSIVTDTAAITDRLAGANTSLSSSADVAHTGSRSLKVHKLAGGAPGSFVLAVPVKPGSRAAFTLWHTKPNQASSGGAVFLTSAAARIEGVKTGGVPNILNTVNYDTFLLSNTDNYIPWTEFSSGMDRIIPSWATHFLLYFNTDAFQGDFYLDDVFIGVM